MNSDDLKKLFSQFEVGALQGISPERFQAHIESEIGRIDAAIEGYADDEIDRQRDLSIKFHWGHNHDFGTFSVDGRMGDRHLNLMGDFMRHFDASPADFEGRRVLDVGCWTGGTSLLLTALGAQVFAIEEVKKYAAMVEFLSRSFGLEHRLTVQPRSIYECDREELYDSFDIVYFPGVVYHLSDPVLALRILFNTLRVGGSIYVESAGIDHPEPHCKFEGSYMYHKNSGDRLSLSRGGWNWFLPSATALSRMMQEAGFEEVRALWDSERKRVYGFGKKTRQVGICRAGLSVKSIR